MSLIVADTSYIAEGILKKKELIEDEEQILTSHLATFELARVLWKHQKLLKDIDDASEYLSILFGLVESRKILLVPPSEHLLQRSLLLARRHDVSVYDAVFVAIAVETGLRLATFDARQSALMRKEAQR